MNKTNKSSVLASVAEQIKSLSEDKAITRDQERIGSEALHDPEFALLANRIMNQGSDPESIRLAEPEAFKNIAQTLDLTEEEAITAIQLAHRSGPTALKESSAEENLWLITASISADESQKNELSDRLIQFAQAIEAIRKMKDKNRAELEISAQDYRQRILNTVQPVSKTEEGIPVYENDLGFYAAYRSGYKAAIVKSDGYDAVGTIPKTTLAEQNLIVDKELSPQFGLRFPETAIDKTNPVSDEPPVKESKEKESVATRRLQFSLASATRTQGDCPGLCWYWWSEPAVSLLRRKMEKNGEKFTPNTAARQARQIANTAMRNIGAMIPDRTDASPYQPNISDLCALVLAFGRDGASWAVKRLRYMARDLKRYCEAKSIYAQPWNTQYSALNDSRCGFRVLVTGITTAIETEGIKAIRKAIKTKDIAFFLRHATSEEFLKGLYEPDKAELRFQYFITCDGKWLSSGAKATAEDIEKIKADLKEGYELQTRPYIYVPDGGYISGPNTEGFPGCLGW